MEDIKMTLFKKFTDFCAGIAAFMGGLFIIQKYMAFKPKTDEEYIQWISTQPDVSKEYASTVTEAPGKISQFLTPELTKNNDYRPIIVLVLVLVLSIFIGRLLKKRPFVCFLVSILPSLTATYLFCQGTLYTQPGLFFMFSTLPIVGNLVECILRDREDGRHRVWAASKYVMIIPIVLCIAVGTAHYVLPDEGLKGSLSIVRELALQVTPELTVILITVGIMYFVILGVTIPLYNVYFIDAILSAIPLIYLIYKLYDEKFSVFTILLIMLAGICFVANLLLCLFENNLSKKEQDSLKEQAVEAPSQESDEALPDAEPSRDVNAQQSE